MFHDFNTSHVNVNHLIKIFNNLTKKHFNTSHVNVNPKYAIGNYYIITFQYISC